MKTMSLHNLNNTIALHISLNFLYFHAQGHKEHFYKKPLSPLLNNVGPSPYHRPSQAGERHQQNLGGCHLKTEEIYQKKMITQKNSQIN